MLQEVRRLAEDLHTLRALEGSVLVHHALMLMRVGQVRYIMATGSTLVPSLAPYLQGGLLGLHSVLLAMLGLLQRGIWLQDDSIHSAAQRVVGPWGERVHYRRWSHCMLLLLLPRLRHPSTSHAGIQCAGDVRRVSVPNLRRWMWFLKSNQKTHRERSRVLSL